MRYRIATEELEVDKYAEAKKQSERSNEFDSLYLKAKAQKEDLIEETVEEPVEDAEEISTDDSENTDEESTDEPAIESFKDLSYGDICLESIAMGATITAIGAAGVTGAAFILGAVSSLAAFGIVVAPFILTKIYKGILFLMTRIVKVTINSIALCDKHGSRLLHSFASLKEDIASLRKALDEIEDKDISDSSFNNERAINTLKIGGSVDFVKNINELSSFLDTTVKQISVQIEKELSAIKYLIAYSTNGNTKVPTKLMTDSLFTNILTKGNIEGFEYNSELMESYVSNNLLPGDIKLLLHIPRNDLADLEQLNSAYNLSTMFLGLDVSSFQNINEVAYMSKDELTEFLSSLDKLCDVCVSHKLLYETVAKKKKAIRYNFKSYFSNIIAADTKVSIGDSLLQYSYLKVVFADKVYLAAAIDLHDYSIKVLTNGIRLAKDNIKKLM